MSNLPQQTLYIRNLDAKVRKQELRRSLYLLFSIHGVLLDVVASKGERMNGQAFVVFADAKSAGDARRSLANASFYGRPLDIFMAKERSFVVDPSVRVKRDTRRNVVKSGGK